MITEEDDEASIYSICVPGKEKKGFYRIKTIWDKNQIKLTLLDESFAYNSILTVESLSNQASGLNITYDDYIKKLQSSLQNDGDGYLYERKDEFFYIYRQPKNITIQLTKFYLEKIDYVEAAENFIDEITKMAVFYKNQLDKCEKKKIIAFEEKKIIAEKLEKYIHLKEDTENDLYSKFILILNEKKKRLQYMNDIITAYKAGRSINEMVEDPCDDLENLTRTKNINRHESISDSDSDSDDCVEQITHIVQIEEDGTSKRKFNFLDDSPEKISLPKRVNLKKSNTIIEKQNISQREPIYIKNNPVINEDEITVSSQTNLEVIEESEASDNDSGFVKQHININSIKMHVDTGNKLVEDKNISPLESEIFDFNTQDLMDRL